MRSLIVEDEFTARMRIKYLLEEYGECDIAVSGDEAIDAYTMSLSSGKEYDLICLDIKMPGKSGLDVLRSIRDIENKNINKKTKKAKIFMTTALDDYKNIKDSFYELCDEYLIKPIKKEKLEKCLKNQGLLK